MVKTELYYDWEGDDPDIFERDLEKYIDWYNNVRIKRRLDGSSPASSLTWRYRVFQWTTYASRFAFKSSKSGASSPDGPRPPLKDSKSGHVPLKDLKSGHVLP